MTAAVAPKTRMRLTETAMALGLVAGRWAWSSRPAWQDWMVVIGLYWLFTAWCRPGRLWSAVTLAVMGYLLVQYCCGQLPRSLELLTVALR
jgi:hypothetical protein